MLLLLLPIAKFCFAADSSLEIVEAGVQSSEDAPFASAEHEFLPGEYLYFTFKIAGFSVKPPQREDQSRQISLAYQVVPENADGVALAPPESGDVNVELSPEDKNWIPKRRASFLIPSFVAAGTFRVHVSVKDLVGKTETAKDFPFRIGGLQRQATDHFDVENFRFRRTPDATASLDVPAYIPGDSVYASFDMVGFKIGLQNRYHLSYDLTVLRPDGKNFVNQTKAAELDSTTFYPAEYLPGQISVKTSPDASVGEYILILTVHDLVAKTSAQVKRAFSLER